MIAKSYLENIRWENFVNDIVRHVNANITHLRKYGLKSGKTLSEVLDDFHSENPDLARIEILDEV